MSQFQEAFNKAKTKFGLDDSVSIYSCYEAGRDGFWLHRKLESIGIHNVVVDSASIEVSRRKRRAKTDQLDVKSLLKLLLRHLGGEEKVWSILHIPTPQQEDARNLHRDLEDLKKERTMHLNRIESLLIAQGIRIKRTLSFMKNQFLVQLETAHTGDGAPLKESLKEKLKREHQRWLLVEAQIKELCFQQAQALKQDTPSEAVKKIKQITAFHGIGATSAWILIFEYFGWRKFRNTKQVGAASGLAPSPFNSGDMKREQGISKAGNPRIRYLMVQLAWRWLRFQPNSHLSRWFEERYAKGSSRIRRVGIIALSRKLLVAIWKYLEYGTLPEGAMIKPAT